MPSLRSPWAVFLCLAASPMARPAADESLAGLTKAVTAFKLPNGAQFFVVNRPYSPMVAFHLRIKAGVADEPSGRGGLAMLALVSFLEGSETFGTRNAAAEKAALAQAAKLLDVARADQTKGDQVDEVKKGHSDFQARAAFDDAAQFGLLPHYFESVLAQNGVSGFEIRSTADFSDLSFTLPSNRVELWFRMVASWLHAPSPRFFLQSRERVTEQRERASRTGSAQRERAFGAYFALHPYQAIAGGDGELGAVVPSDMLEFLKTRYVPANLTVAMVGDVEPAEARRLADFYFAKLPAAEPPAAKDALPLNAETAQAGRLAVAEAPVFSAGWPRPAASDPSDPVFDVLEAILAGGTGSYLQHALSVEARLAARLSVNPHFPGTRYPGLFVLEAEPLPTQSLEELEAAIVKTIGDVAKNGVTAADLERGRRWWRQRFVGESASAAGRANQLIRSHTENGTYRIEELLARQDAVTSQQCQQILNQYLAGRSYFSIAQLTAVAGGAGGVQ